MTFDGADLQIYGVGVCVGAIGVWLVLKWRDEDLTPFQWVLAFAAILFWPVLFALRGLIRIALRVKFHYEMRKDERSPDRM
jgi:hypothetical protein